MPFLIAPTDSKLAALLDSPTSSIPERLGADVLHGSPKGLIAWQRKELADLFASIQDGRLARELPLLQKASYPVLIIEGWPSVTADGHLLLGYNSRWTLASLRNLLRSVEYEHGVRVERTDSLQDTADAIRELETWLSKATHKSLLIRPKSTDRRNDWGEKVQNRRAFARHLLQSFEGIGLDRADQIYDSLGIPLAWTCSQTDLRKVPGIGPITAKRLWRLLHEAEPNENGIAAAGSISIDKHERIRAKQKTDVFHEIED